MTYQKFLSKAEISSERKKKMFENKKEQKLKWSYVYWHIADTLLSIV